MDAQDFETYARVKPFNLSVADTWSASLTEVLDRLAMPRAEVRLLDQGCGDGKYFPQFVALGLTPVNIHGVEVSRVRIERCHEMGWGHAVYVEKGQSLPYPDDYFDVVNFMEVIEHIPGTDIGNVLAEIRRVMKPSGILMGSTPNYPIKRFYDLYDAVVHRMWIRLKDDPTHVSFYNPEKLRRLLGEYFTVIEMRYFKSGFLYRRLAKSSWLMHKMLFVCGGKNPSRPSA
jgi:SAM-dependent methyltransferase